MSRRRPAKLIPAERFTRKVIPLERMNWIEVVNDCMPVFNREWKHSDLAPPGRLAPGMRASLEKEFGDIRELKDVPAEEMEEVGFEEEEDMGDLKRVPPARAAGSAARDLALCRRAVKQLAKHRKCGNLCPGAGIQPPEAQWVFAMDRLPLRTRVRHCNEENYKEILGPDFVPPLEAKLNFRPDSKAAIADRTSKVQSLLGLWERQREEKDNKALSLYRTQLENQVKAQYPFSQFGLSSFNLRRGALETGVENQRRNLLRQRILARDEEKKRIEQIVYDQQAAEAKWIHRNRDKIIDQFCRASYARVAGQFEDTIHQCRDVYRKQIPLSLLQNGPYRPRGRNRLTREQERRNSFLETYNILGARLNAYHQGDYTVQDKCPYPKLRGDCLDDHGERAGIKVFTPYDSVTDMQAGEGYIRNTDCELIFRANNIKFPPFGTNIPSHQRRLLELSRAAAGL